MALSDVWRLFQTVDRLLVLEAKHGQSLDALRADVSELERRVGRLEQREDLIAVEARSAARAGAADAMQGVILRIGERLGALEADSKPARPPATRKRRDPDPS